MKHRDLWLVAILAACGSHAAAPQPGTSTPEHGVFVADLDRSVDPCTDFFEFSNGTWRKQNPIPASMPRWSRRWQAGETAKDRLKEILDEVSARTDWPHASVEQLIGDFYGGCMDQAKIDQRGIAPIKPLLAEIDQLREPADIGRMIARLAGLGVGVPFGMSGNSDYHTPTNVIAWIGSAGLGLPDRDYYLKTEPRFIEARAKYLVHVAAVFKLAGRDDAAAKRAADTVMAFELGLAKATLDNVATRDPASTDHAMLLPELQQLTPSFDWATYFKASGVQPTRLNVTEPAFFAEVERQLKTTPVADWKTYLSWQLLSSEAPSLSQPFVDEDFAFNEKYLGGTEEMKPRWKRCVEATDAQLGEALGKKYVDKYFPPAAKARMQRMVKNLLASVKDSIAQLAWMSPATKQRALQKLATFNPKIGYPDKWKDYSSIPVRREQYWESLAAARVWNVNDGLSQIGKPLDRGRWGMTPPTSDAYYNPSLNEIVFPAGILQPPFYDPNRDDAYNYGAVGSVIGHEMTHGFDDQGAKFDAKGNLSNWWTPADLAAFQKQAECIQKQFDEFKVGDVSTNGKLVSGESIADLAGLKIAYAAYKKSQEGKPRVSLDGYTPEQRFFLGYAHSWASTGRPEFERLIATTDPHPLDRFRANAPLTNMPEFASAFGCKTTDPMVRAEEKRCIVW